MKDSYTVQLFQFTTGNLLDQIVTWKQEAKEVLNANESMGIEIAEMLERENLSERERVHYEFEKTRNQAERDSINQTIQVALNQMEDAMSWKATAEDVSIMKLAIEKMCKKLKSPGEI